MVFSGDTVYTPAKLQCCNWGFLAHLLPPFLPSSQPSVCRDYTPRLARKEYLWNLDSVWLAQALRWRGGPIPGKEAGHLDFCPCVFGLEALTQIGRSYHKVLSPLLEEKMNKCDTTELWLCLLFNSTGRSVASASAEEGRCWQKVLECGVEYREAR